LFVVPVSIRDAWLSAPVGARAPEPRILWLGKLRRYKCPDHAIRSMTAVTKVVDNAHLTIAGRRDDARYERELRDLVDRLVLGKSVDFQFDLTEDAKRDLIRSSSVLVVPSVVEGFGIVVLEANASGVPVVASSGVPEGAVRDRYNGLRYSFGDIDAMGEAIVEILSDEHLHAELSTNGLAFAKSFGWQTVGSQFEAVVEMAATNRHTNRRARANHKS
jgi:glycosyltransferase involved in cell wall biosynthesis